MDIEFMYKKLEDFCDGKHTLRLGRDIQHHLQRKVDLLLSIKDIDTLRKIRSLKYETYGSGKYQGKSSIRLNDQYRLMMEVKTSKPQKLFLLEITDYH